MSILIDSNGLYTDPKKYDLRSSMSPLVRYCKLVSFSEVKLLIKKYVNNNKLKIVADLGCGTLDYTKLIKNVDKIYAVDINKEMINMGRKKMLSFNGILDIRVEDVRKTSIPKNSCDGIISVGLSDYIGVDLLLREISRISKKGAIIIFSFPNYLNQEIFLERLFQRLTNKTFVKTAYSSKYVFRLLAEHGFCLLDYKNIATIFWVPTFLQLYLLPLWKILERINMFLYKKVPLGAYSYVVAVKN